MGSYNIFLVQLLFMQASSFVISKPLKTDFLKAATDDYLSFIAYSGPFVSTVHIKPKLVSATRGDYLSSIAQDSVVKKPLSVKGDYLSSIAQDNAVKKPVSVKGDYLSSIAQDTVVNKPDNVKGDYLSLRPLPRRPWPNAVNLDTKESGIAYNNMPAVKPATGMPAVKPATGMPVVKPAPVKPNADHDDKSIVFTDGGMPAVKPDGAGADYLSSLASYEETGALNMPTINYLNKELKNAQLVLLDSLSNITEEFLLKTISLLRNNS